MQGPMFGIGIMELVILAVLGGGCMLGVGGLVAVIVLATKKSKDEN